MEKRRHDRQLCSSLIEVSVLAGKSRGSSFCAVIEDVSRAGVCLLMDGALEVGSMVGLRPGDRVVRAFVRHCTLCAPGEYRIGAEFVDYEWTNEDGWPEHVFRVLPGAPTGASAN
jgi:hypothetical protein